MILGLCPNPSIDSYAHILNFHPGEVNRISVLEEFPGGKGVHVALALAELDTESKLLGFWAGGSGDWIKKECEARKVKIDGLSIEGNNRKCYTFISDTPTLHHTELLEPGPKITEAHFERFQEVFKKRIAETELICMSGSWPTNAPEDAYAQLIDIAKKNAVIVILDCTGIQLKNALEKGFFGIHLNHHEAKALCGADDMLSLREYLGNRVELIALTRGSEGLELAYKNEIIKARIKLEPEEIVSTVGSGDCLTAGIAYALSQQFNLTKIAAYGAACGTANCLNKDLGMLRKIDVENMLKKVQIEKHEQ